MDIQQPVTPKTLEAFAGRKLTQEVSDNINHPCNGLNFQADAHESFDKLAWGIHKIGGRGEQCLALRF